MLILSIHYLCKCITVTIDFNSVATKRNCGLPEIVNICYEEYVLSVQCKKNTYEVVITTYVSIRITTRTRPIT